MLPTTHHQTTPQDRFGNYDPSDLELSAHELEAEAGEPLVDPSVLRQAAHEAEIALENGWGR